MPRRMRTQAIVLNRDEAGESHRLVTLLTKDYGKLKVFAPGARRSKRRFAGSLELFAHIEASIVERASGRLPQLEEAILIDPHEAIKSDLIAIGHAGYLTELAAAMLGERDPAVEIYDLVAETLSSLDRGPLGAFEIRRFELAVLAYSGIAPQLSSCLVCSRESATAWKFDFQQGGVVCGDCQSGSAGPQRLDAGALDLLRRVQKGDPPTQAKSADMAAARTLLSRIIDDHVGHPLKAREFLYQIAKKSK